jgi:murein L,D-transpeptidase YcbB/YkuD
VPVYAALRSTLATYRALAAGGGWKAVSDGPTLHPGEHSPRVGELRARLCASGDLRGDHCGIEGEAYDDALVTALSHFQGRHQLDADGVLGKRTLAELNVPVTARIDQIRVNLERARWLLHDLPGDYVLVDIAGYELVYVRGGKELLRSRTVVGKPYRKTPIFRSAISYIEFAPTWTVPPTILRNDVLPEIRKDPAYLAKKRMRLIDAGGGEIDPAGVNWSQYKGKRVPAFVIRQDPGPENSLGRVKFMFPNGHQVYLHDTPARELFARSERSYSSGCIRVEQAARLAELLLERQGWDAARVAAAMGESTPRRVDLTVRVPVLLYYWTVAREDDGDIRFKRDIYGGDAAILKGLDGA